jgi:Beta-lactamase enzyme family
MEVLLSLLLFFSRPACAGEPAALGALCPLRPAALRPLLSPRMTAEAEPGLILETLAGNERRYGPCRSVKKETASYRFEFAEASVVGELRFDNKGRLEDFSFGPALYPHDGATALLAALQKRFPDSALYVERAGRETLAFRADEPLNISRSFHLFLIEALNHSFAKGETHPQDTVRLDEEARLVSFGLLHDWAPGTWLTLDSLKNLVAVENDATAADLLLARLGRNAVEREGSSLAPLLSNREAALLRNLLPPSARPVNRAEALSRLASLPTPSGAVDFPPERFDLISTVGWFASARELCGAANAVKADPALQHGMVKVRQGPEIAGATLDLRVETRDPGISQTTLLFHDRQGSACIALTLNQAKAIDEIDARDLLARAEALLKMPLKSTDKASKTKGTPNP